MSSSLNAPYEQDSLPVMAVDTAAKTGEVQSASPLAWAAVAFVAFQVMLGETLRLPNWVEAISPFWHLPGIPVEHFQFFPAVAVLALAAGLVLLGLWGYQRRDLNRN